MGVEWKGLRATAAREWLFSSTVPRAEMNEKMWPGRRRRQERSAALRCSPAAEADGKRRGETREFANASVRLAHHLFEVLGERIRQVVVQLIAVLVQDHVVRGPDGLRRSEGVRERWGGRVGGDASNGGGSTCKVPRL